jgi:hypothetical protein
VLCQRVHSQRLRAPSSLVTTRASPGLRNSRIVSSSIRPSRERPETFSVRMTLHPACLRACRCRKAHALTRGIRTNDGNTPTSDIHWGALFRRAEQISTNPSLGWNQHLSLHQPSRSPKYDCGTQIGRVIRTQFCPDCEHSRRMSHSDLIRADRASQQVGERTFEACGSGQAHRACQRHCAMDPPHGQNANSDVVRR